MLLATGGLSAEAAAADPEVIALDVERHRFDLRRDAALARSVRGITARLRPDVVHLITVKPVLFGALGLLGEACPRRIVATVPGLGRVFDPAQNSPKARLRRALVCKGLSLGLSPERVRAVFETEADSSQLLSFGVLACSTSGVRCMYRVLVLILHLLRMPRCRLARSACCSPAAC